VILGRTTRTILAGDLDRPLTKKMGGEGMASARFATCRTREGCDKTNGLLLVAVLLLSRQLPTPSTRHAEIVPQGGHGA